MVFTSIEMKPTSSLLLANYNFDVSIEEIFGTL